MKWFILSSIFLSGCTTNHELKLQFESSNIVNQDKNYKSMPVMLKVYTTTSQSKLRYLRYVDYLSDKVVPEATVHVMPGSITSIEMNAESIKKYVHVVALFSKCESSKWKAVTKLPKGIFLRQKKFYLRANEIKEV